MQWGQTRPPIYHRHCKLMRQFKQYLQRMVLNKHRWVKLSEMHPPQLCVATMCAVNPPKLETHPKSVCHHIPPKQCLSTRAITCRRPCKLQLLVANGQRCEEGLKALDVSH